MLCSLSPRRGVGLIGVIIILLVVAILAYSNWDKIVEKKVGIDAAKERATESLESAEEQVKAIEEKIKEQERRFEKKD